MLWLQRQRETQHGWNDVCASVREQNSPVKRQTGLVRAAALGEALQKADTMQIVSRINSPVAGMTGNSPRDVGLEKTGLTASFDMASDMTFEREVPEVSYIGRVVDRDDHYGLLTWVTVVSLRPGDIAHI